jgi:hypothetical protein
MSLPSSGQKKNQVRNQCEAGSKTAYYLQHANFFLGLFFDSENASDMFLRNVGLF